MANYMAHIKWTIQSGLPSSQPIFPNAESQIETNINIFPTNIAVTAILPTPQQGNQWYFNMEKLNLLFNGYDLILPV